MLIFKLALYLIYILFVGEVMLAKSTAVKPNVIYFILAFIIISAAVLMFLVWIDMKFIVELRKLLDYRSKKPTGPNPKPKS